MLRGITLSAILACCVLISTPIAKAEQKQLLKSMDPSTFAYARYGWKNWVYVGHFVQMRCLGVPSCSFKVGNELFGDPAPGEDKFFQVKASNGACVQIPEGQTAVFSVGSNGNVECRADGKWCTSHCSGWGWR